MCFYLLFTFSGFVPVEDEEENEEDNDESMDADATT